MLADRIEAKWIDAFCEVFERCAVKAGDTAAILSETQSRALNVHLAELALLRMGARPFHVVVPTPRNKQIVPIRSTGASEAIQRLAPVVTALQQAGFVVDCTIEGLMHAPETPEILKAGTRILLAENEHRLSLKDALAEHSPADELLLACGPEGGWSEEELALFTKNGWTLATLGNTILRAETAAIAAMAIAFAELS